ncbi:MAG: GyrI-like domain-containing protein [Rhodobacteraceae bacterium]|nr:GyrI-like domain-containing protein [Paracoccaceae bacterium]
MSIRCLPARRLAVLHNVGPYSGSTVFAKLLRAAQAQGLRCQPIFGLSYDDPALVPSKDLRSAVGVEIGNATPLSAPLELLEIPATRFATFAYRGPNERLGLAYDWVFGQWLPASGESPANQPALSIYYDSPQNTAPENLRTDICIPLLERTPHARKA